MRQADHDGKILSAARFLQGMTSTFKKGLLLDPFAPDTGSVERASFKHAIRFYSPPHLVETSSTKEPATFVFLVHYNMSKIIVQLTCTMLLLFNLLFNHAWIMHELVRSILHIRRAWHKLGTLL